MNKKIIFLMTIFIMILSLASCKKNFYSEYKDAYDLAADNVYEEISIDDFYNKLDNKDSFIVYYGQKECINCLMNVGFFDKNAKKLGIEKIYYLRSKILDANGDEKRVQTLQARVGFDNDNSPDASPRLWAFIDGIYNKGMANFVTKDDELYDNASYKLMAYYLDIIQK